MLSFFPLDVLEEIESVSEGFLTYSYQMSITVTEIFSFIAGGYCTKENFFLIVFFSAKEVPFLKVRLRK